LLPDVAAPNCAKAAFPMIDASISRGDREMHKTDRLARRRTTWPGDTGDRNRKVDVGIFQCTKCHGDRGFLADGSKGLERRGLNPKHRVLGFVGIGDEAAVDDVRRAWNISQRRRHQTARAGFRGRNRQFAHPA
jgi:hypothetical protein